MMRHVSTVKSGVYETQKAVSENDSHGRPSADKNTPASMPQPCLQWAEWRRFEEDPGYDLPIESLKGVAVIHLALVYLDGPRDLLVNDQPTHHILMPMEIRLVSLFWGGPPPIPEPIEFAGHGLVGRRRTRKPVSIAA
jgi:hypothetical protein